LNIKKREVAGLEALLNHHKKRAIRVDMGCAKKTKDSVTFVPEPIIL